MYFAYTRKSTESDERQVQSIEDQINWINNNVWWNSYKLYSESKSAKDPYIRTQFQQMIKDIQKSKNKCIIICWKLDRLSRNPIDSWTIQYLMQKWKIEKIITNDREYNPVDAGLLMSVENAMSNQFILDMVKNVERWMKSKIEKGWCIQTAPLWYINNTKTKEIDVDKETAPLVKEIFKLRAKNYSFNSIADEMNKKGLKWKQWWKITKTTIEQILKNPFYIWFQKYKWELHKSIHEKLVDVKLWKKINAEKRWYIKHNAEMEFPLKWIVKSYHTKKPLLALWKKQKYIYYSTHSREDFVINLNQNHIIEYFDAIIYDYCIPDKDKSKVLEWIKEWVEWYNISIKDQKKILKNKTKELDKKSQRLFDLVLSWTISDEKYKKEENELKIEQAELEQNIKWINDLEIIFIQSVNELVELLVNLKTMRKTAEKNKKIEIIKLIVVELFVDTKKQLYIQEKELFEIVKVLNGLWWQTLSYDGGTDLIQYLLINKADILDIKKQFEYIKNW